MDSIDTTNVEKMKIVVIGESGVGKTCLINRYVKNVFDVTEPTVGSYFNSRDLNASDGSMTIKQMIWDTAGQEIYRSLTSFYYRDADAIILVYDVTSKKTFDELSYWMQEIKRHCTDDILLTIAGNKSDKVGDEKVNVVEAENFAKANRASFFLVSAKEDSNVTEMYTELGIRKFEKHRSKFGYKIDAASKEAKVAIESQDTRKSKKEGNQKLRNKAEGQFNKKDKCC